nr:methyltransferase domain-containing protein [Blastocatellia bacterium]
MKDENIQLLQAFLKNPGKVGSITPSSPELAAKMLQGVKPDADNIVLELGVGTGAITKYLEQIIPDRNSYLGIELDSELVENLQAGHPNLNVVCANAMDAYEIHRKSGLGKVRYLVCCLPFVSLPKEVTERVLSEVEKFMHEGCELRMFQYAHGYYLPPAIKIREYLRDRYGKSKRSQLILKNMPPAFT